MNNLSKVPSFELLRYIDKPLYRIVLNLGGYEYSELFTKIPFAEYRRIRHAMKYLSVSIEDLEDQIFQYYTVPSKKYTVDEIGDLPAGVVTTVVSCIMELSDSSTFPDQEGKVDPEGLQARFNAQRIMVRSSPEYDIYTVICSVFRGYRFQDLEKLPFDEILRLFACAEKYLLMHEFIKEPYSFFTQGPGVPERPVESPRGPDPDPRTKPPSRPSEGPGDAPESEEEEMLLNFMKFQKEQEAKAAVKPQVTISAKEPPQKKQEEPEMLVIKREKARPSPEINLGEEEPAPVVKEQRVPMDEWVAYVNETIKPIPVSPKNPNFKKLQELELRRVETIRRSLIEKRPLRSGHLTPPDAVVNANGMPVHITPINEAAGFTEDDFSSNLPLMTEEEALAEAIKAGYTDHNYIPGQKTLTKKERVEQMYKERFGDRKPGVRELAKFRKELKQAGLLE